MVAAHYIYIYYVFDYIHIDTSEYLKQNKIYETLDWETTN